MFPTNYFPRFYFAGRYWTPDSEAQIPSGWTTLEAKPSGDSDTWTTITPPGES